MNWIAVSVNHRRGKDVEVNAQYEPALSQSTEDAGTVVSKLTLLR
jgi:hypothetical protein